MAGWHSAACITIPPSSCPCTSTSMCSAGPRQLTRARRSSAAAWSTAPSASRPCSCTSATTPATSRRRRRTGWRRNRLGGQRSDLPPNGSPERLGASTRLLLLDSRDPQPVDVCKNHLVDLVEMVPVHAVLVEIAEIPLDLLGFLRLVEPDVAENVRLH